MSTPDGQVEGDERDEARSAVSLGRLLAFSDGVFAIAITILVLDINVPEDLTDDGLVDALAGQLPNLAAAALSFAVIGRFWIAHHAIFSVIRRSDHRLLSLNLVLLGPIVLLPFVTKLLADYGATPLVVIAYSGTVAAVALAETVVFGYATRGRRLVAKDMEPLEIRNGLARAGIVAFAFLTAIPVALFAPTIAMLVWVLSALPTRSMLSRAGAGGG